VRAEDQVLDKAREANVAETRFKTLERSWDKLVNRVQSTEDKVVKKSEGELIDMTEDV
jgi:hypothetical protein